MGVSLARPRSVTFKGRSHYNCNSGSACPALLHPRLPGLLTGNGDPPTRQQRINETNPLHTHLSQERLTPLHNTALAGHTEVARLLLAAGAKHLAGRVSCSTGCGSGYKYGFSTLVTPPRTCIILHLSVRYSIPSPPHSLHVPIGGQHGSPLGLLGGRKGRGGGSVAFHGC